MAWHGKAWHGRKRPRLFLDHKFEIQSWKWVHRVNVTKRYRSKLNKSCPSRIPIVAAARSYSWPVRVHRYIALLFSFTLSGYIYGKSKKNSTLPCMHACMYQWKQGLSILRSNRCVWLLCKFMKHGSVGESILISEYVLAYEVCIILFFSCSKKLVVLKMKPVNWTPILMWLNLLVILFLLCSLRCKSLYIQMYHNLQNST